MFYPINFQMILISKKGEITAECHDEFAYVADNLVFHNFFIHTIIFFLNVFGMDVVQKILILEHPDCFQSLLCIWNCFNEII